MNMNIAYTARNIKEENPTYEELKSCCMQAGCRSKRFLKNKTKKIPRRGEGSRMIYKSLGLKDKLPTMSEEEQLRLLLATDGMLVKRPNLVNDDVVLVGFRETEWTGTLL